MTTAAPRAAWSRRLLTAGLVLAVVCAFAATTALVAQRNLATAASTLLLALVAGASAGASSAAVVGPPSTTTPAVAMTRWTAVGVLLGVAFAAAVLGGVGALLRLVLPGIVAQVVVGAAALVVVLREAGVLGFPLPANPMRIPADVPDDDEWGEARTGFALGTGMRSGVPGGLASGLPHLVALALALTVPFGMAFVVAAGFGIGVAATVAARPEAVDGRWLAPAAGVRLLLALECAVALAVSMTVTVAGHVTPGP